MEPWVKRRGTQTRVMLSVLGCSAAMLLASTAAHAGDEAAGLALSVDQIRLEGGHFLEAPGVSSGVFARAEMSAAHEGDNWSLALGVMFDAHAQGGARNFERVRAEYGENHLQWHGESTRLTLGTQRIVWGRVDEISPIDRFGRNDFSRALVDELADRRLATPAVRAEHFTDDMKLDLVWVPVFDPSRMPERESIWHPVDTRQGRLLGIGQATPVAGASVKSRAHGSGGAGLRLTREGDVVDLGFSVQRVRQTQPYYRLEPGVLTTMHPFSWVLGGELEAALAGATWRFELAWSSDAPVTTHTLAYRTVPRLDAVLGAEWFPGDGETRVTLQLASQRLITATPLLDRSERHALTGEVEHPFGQGRWKAGLRFIVGLGEHDLYLNPRIAYVGFDQHELFLAGHVFSGSERTLGGYYRDNDMLMAGWRARF